MRGPAVDLSTHLTRVGAPGDVLVSRTVRDLVAGSGLALEPRCVRRLGDDAQEWEIFAAEVPPPAAT